MVDVCWLWISLLSRFPQKNTLSKSSGSSILWGSVFAPPVDLKMNVQNVGEHIPVHHVASTLVGNGSQVIAEQVQIPQEEKATNASRLGLLHE